MRERVTISSCGVITIPANMREASGLGPDSELILETVDQGILLRPSVSMPVEVYSEERIAEFTTEEESLGRYFSDER